YIRHVEPPNVDSAGSCCRSLQAGSGQAPSFGVQCEELLQVSQGLLGGLLQNLLGNRSDPRKTYTTGKKGLHRHFVRRVQHGRTGSPGTQGSPGETESRKALLIRWLEGELPQARQIQSLDRRSHAPWPGQTVGERGAHIRNPQLRQNRSVAVADHGVNDRLGMYEDLDLLFWQVEKIVGLDQLQALVHHRGRIDRDLGAYFPIGMSDRLCRRNLLHCL